MCVGFAIVSMVGTNFHDSKLIKGDSAPGPNEIGRWAQVRSGPIGPHPFFFFFLFRFFFSIFFFIFFFISFFFRYLLFIFFSNFWTPAREGPIRSL